MKKVSLKAIAYVLTLMIIVETAFISIPVYSSDEVAGFDKIQESKIKATNWLLSNQKKDGSFGDNSPVYYTTQVLNNLALESSLYEGSFLSKSLDLLNNVDINNNDDFFRLYRIRQTFAEYAEVTDDAINTDNTADINNTDSKNGIEDMNDISEVVALQNEDGGFGLNDDYKSDVLTTLLALACIRNDSGIHETVINNSIKYLKGCQNEDGSFSYCNSKDSPSIYLTALACETISFVSNEYSNKKSSSPTRISDACIAYLRNAEADSNLDSDSNLWGLSEDELKSTLMASIVLINDENTLDRIGKISELMGENGSLYNDIELTSLYVRLVNEYELLTGKLDLDYVKINDISVNSEKNFIGAYTNVLITPEVVGMKENYSMTVSVTDNKGYTKSIDSLENSNVFLWNTENRSGEMDIIVTVYKKDNGDILAIKTKKVSVKETLEVKALSLNVTPKSYKIDSGKTVKIDSKAYVLTNVVKNIKASVCVKKEHNETVFEDTDIKKVSLKDKEINFKEFLFVPETDGTTFYTVTERIEDDGKLLKEQTQYIKVNTSEDENRIDIDYHLSDSFVYPKTTDIKVDFVLSGKGLSENIKRKPMDIGIILDDSGSLTEEDFLKELDAAKMLVDCMQPEDKAAVKYLNISKAVCSMTSDKNAIIAGIDKRNSTAGWYSWTKIDESIDAIMKEYSDDPDREKIIYIFSDGLPTNESRAYSSARKAVEKGVKIYTFGLGDVGRKFMEEVANIGGGTYVEADSGEDIEACMKALLGDIFMMAGKDVMLEMTIDKDIPNERTRFEAEPDRVTENEDGTTTIAYMLDYLSVGDEWNQELVFNISDLIPKKEQVLLSNITLKYTDGNEETIITNLNDIILNVVNDVSEIDDVSLEEEPDDSSDDAENTENNLIITEVENSGILSHNKLDEEEQTKNKNLYSGKIELSKDEITVGDELTADVEINVIKVNNFEDENDSYHKTRVVIFDTSNEKEVSVTEKTLGEIDAKDTLQIDTDSLNGGCYMTVLMVEDDGEMLVLDARGLKVNNSLETPQNTDEEVSQGTDARETDTQENNIQENNTQKTDTQEISKSTDLKADEATGNNKLENQKQQNNNKGKSYRISEVVTSNEISKVNKISKNANSLNEKEKSEKETATESKHFYDSLSPLTGDFSAKDYIRILLLVQSISLILICISLKKQKEERVKE